MTLLAVEWAVEKKVFGGFWEDAVWAVGSPGPFVLSIESVVAGAQSKESC